MTVHYVPAGAEGYSERRVQLLVTSRPNAKESTDHGKLFKRWNTYDRTITMTATTGRKSVYCDDNADLIVPINNPVFVKNCGLTKVLANPIHGNFVRSPFKALGIESIVDSGGFQMRKGTADFVELDDLVTRYNAQADIGMPLDLPVTYTAELTLFDAISKLIKANDDYLLARLNKNVDLPLISHGHSVALRESRLDAIDRKASVVAIAQLGNKFPAGMDPLAIAIENFMYVVHRYHHTTRYFHVLGLTSKLWLFIYALLDATGYVKSIGADSVSHRLGALTGMYDTYDFNSILLTKKLTYKQTLPCTCPVCVSIDDMRIMSQTVILEAHNLWMRAQWTKLMSDLAKQYVAGTVTLAGVHSALRLKMTINELHKYVAYIEKIIATDKFRPLRVKSVSKSLFGHRAAHCPSLARYTQIIKHYEKVHGKKFL